MRFLQSEDLSECPSAGCFDRSFLRLRSSVGKTWKNIPEEPYGFGCKPKPVFAETKEIELSPTWDKESPADSKSLNLFHCRTWGTSFALI